MECFKARAGVGEGVTGVPFGDIGPLSRGEEKRRADAFAWGRR